MKLSKRRYVMTARTAKAAATRERIRSGAVELYCGRAIEDFTLEEVAHRAGTTVQTVLRAFGSKENLLFAALSELAASGAGLKPSPPGDIRAAVAAIFDVYEAMGDFVVQRLGDEHRRPAFKPLLDQGRKNHRDWLRIVFAPQLLDRHGADWAQLFSALDVATDVYVWRLLRRDQGLSRPAAEAVVRRMIRSMTQKEVSHDDKRGTDPLAELVGRRQPAP